MMWWSWVLMSLGMLVFWTLVGFGIYWLVRSTRSSPTHRHDAEEILRERFAQGEISVEEYVQRTRMLDDVRKSA